MMKKARRWFVLGALFLVCVAPRWVAAQDGAAQDGSFVCYEVPALSSVPRMPDTLPTDGRLSSQLRLVAAKGELEPVSFVIAPRADIARLELKATDLAGAEDVIPAANVVTLQPNATVIGAEAAVCRFARRS